MALTAGDIMDAAAVLLNDAVKTQYTYYVQIPYLNMAINELQEHMELNNVPITNEVTTAISVAVGVTAITSATNPAIPTNLIEIQQISERLDQSSEDYIPMTRREFLPPMVEQIDSLVWWVWQNQEIRFLGATTPRQLQINYIASRMFPVSTNADLFTIINCKSFLSYRTAALCAKYIGKDDDTYNSMSGDIQSALDRFLGVSAKGRQAIATRRRPFMAAYKTRGIW
jgi:hypothetical protein